MLVLYCRYVNRAEFGYILTYYTLISHSYFYFIFYNPQVSQIGTVAQKYQSLTQNTTPNIFAPVTKQLQYVSLFPIHFIC
jgi:hypothetical protein